MLTGSQLRSKIDALWDKLWNGGLSNPLDAIEQLSFFCSSSNSTNPSRARQTTRQEVPNYG
jgi:type I restriction enzyme M protein